MTTFVDPSAPARMLYRRIERSQWAELAPELDQPLTEDEISRLRRLGDHLDIKEVREVYLPLSKLLSLYARSARALHRSTSDLLEDSLTGTPFVIAITGSVAVGKSTIARLLRDLLSRWCDTPRVELVTTDGFLYPNAELKRRGLMRRKGFPESYDRPALIQFLRQVKSGVPEVRAPVYSHLRYDIIDGEHVTVNRPDVVIVEGLNVLQPPRPPDDISISELFDFSIYVDADVDDIGCWYVDRFMALKQEAFKSPDSYFTVYGTLTDRDAARTATGLWQAINLPNLRLNVLPTRQHARLVLRKRSDHTVESVMIRKL